MKKKRRTWLTCLVIALLVIIVSCICLVAAGGLGYYLYSSGTITRDGVLKLLGRADGAAAVVNISDEKLTALLVEAEPKSSDEPLTYSIVLEDTEIQTLMSKPGRYILTLTLDSGREQVCYLHFANGDRYTLVVMPEGTTITREGSPPANGQDLNLETSSLCAP